MGQSTRRTLYHAFLILIISIENNILCQSTSEENSAELLETVSNMFSCVKNTPRDKLMNVMLNMAAAKGLLPDGTRPMWPQRPAKPTQIQEPPTSSNLYQFHFNPSTAHTTPVLQNPFTATSSRSPVVFPEIYRLDAHPNLITPHEANPTLQSNGIDRSLVLIDPAQNCFQHDDRNVLSHGDRTAQTNINGYQYGNNPSNTFIISPEYFNSDQPFGFPIAIPGPNPSVAQYPIFMENPDKNVISPLVLPVPIQFAPMTYPPYIETPPNALPLNAGIPNVIIINPLQSTCQCDEPQVVTLTEETNAIPEISNLGPVAQSSPEVQYVPYNLEMNLPISTTLIPTSDSGSLVECRPQIAPNSAFPPLMDYPPFPFLPPPMPFLPPIVIQQQGPKSKSNDLLKILLLSQILPFGFVGNNKCGC